MRRRLYLILEGGHAGGLAGMIVETSLIVLILLNVAGYILQSVPSIRQPYWFDLEILEAASVLIFTVEYALRLWVAAEDPVVREKGRWHGRLHAAAKPLMVIDFLAVAPVYFSLLVPVLDLRFLRLIRLLRLLKIARYSPALSTLGEVIMAERRALFGTLMVLFCTTVFAAAVMHAVEGGVQPEKFGSIPSSMWWAITTLTTVGYGDEVPITALGRVVAGITMITGMGILALPVGIVATGFMETIHRRDFVVTFGMLARVPLFKDFSARFLSEVMNLLRAQAVDRGEIITVRGAPANAMYFVISGEVEVQFASRTMQLGPGDFFGELALLHRTQRTATVVARSYCRLLALSAEDFTMLLQQYPRLKKRIEDVAAKHARELGDIPEGELSSSREYSWLREDD